VVVARELSSEPKLLIASQPTRGLDVGAIEFVHKRLLAQRDQGKAILLVSLELDEIMSLSDRILVIYEGQIVGEMAASEATEGELGLLMAGGHGKRGLDTERSERSGQYGQQFKNPSGHTLSLSREQAVELFIPVVAVLIALVLGALLILFIGKSPLTAYGALLKGSFGSKRDVAETLINVTPLIFTGLSVAFSFKCGPV